MSRYTNFKERIDPNGLALKILSTINVAIVFIVINFVIDLYTAGDHAHNNHAIWLNYVLSIVAIPIFGFIASVQGNEYGIEMIKNKKSLIKKLDERQLDARRRVFEKSYTLLAAILFFSASIFPNWVQGKLTTEGTFIVGFNVAIFVLALPSLVAIWNKSPKHVDMGNELNERH